MTVITRYRGDTYPIKIQIFNRQTRQPVDITGMSAILSVSTRQNPTASPDVFSSVGIPQSPTVDGVFHFPITASQANNLSIRTHYYDVQVTDAMGEVRTIEKDEFRVIQDITK